ncbi:portal protein [Campylobacter hepaticus]|uniref:portal protein n=1 Tax=Campylobacter hepaticus TaxID=1813019 RepID=UPI003F8D0EF7
MIKTRFYGFFRNLKPIVDSINFTENRILNMLSSIKIIFENDAVDDPDKFAQDINLDNAAVAVKSGGLSKIRVEKQSNEIIQISQKQAEKKTPLE